MITVLAIGLPVHPLNGEKHSLTLVCLARKPLMTSRKFETMSKPESGYGIWDQVGRHLFSAQSATGTEVERARFVVKFRSISSVFSYFDISNSEKSNRTASIIFNFY